MANDKRARGPRSKKTEEVIQCLEHDLELGLSWKTAAACAGIGESTVHEWRAEDSELAERLDAAVARGIRRAAEEHRNARTDNPRALEWFLERREPAFKPTHSIEIHDEPDERFL